MASELSPRAFAWAHPPNLSPPLTRSPRPTLSNPRRSNTRVGVGTFYEGVIASGYTTDDVDDALQRNVVGAGYGVPAR